MGANPMMGYQGSMPNQDPMTAMMAGQGGMSMRGLSGLGPRHELQMMTMMMSSGRGFPGLSSRAYNSPRQLIRNYIASGGTMLGQGARQHSPESMAVMLGSCCEACQQNGSYTQRMGTLQSMWANNPMQGVMDPYDDFGDGGGPGGCGS